MFPFFPSIISAAEDASYNAQRGPDEAKSSPFNLLSIMMIVATSTVSFVLFIVTLRWLCRKRRGRRNVVGHREAQFIQGVRMFLIYIGHHLFICLSFRDFNNPLFN